MGLCERLGISGIGSYKTIVRSYNADEERPMSNISHADLSSSVKYQIISDTKSYTDAHAACQGHKNQHLAKINDPDELTQAKNASDYCDSKKYWTALQVL